MVKDHGEEGGELEPGMCYWEAALRPCSQTGTFPEKEARQPCAHSEHPGRGNLVLPEVLLEHPVIGNFVLPRVLLEHPGIGNFALPRVLL